MSDPMSPLWCSPEHVSYPGSVHLAAVWLAYRLPPWRPPADLRPYTRPDDTRALLSDDPEDRLSYVRGSRRPG